MEGTSRMAGVTDEVSYDYGDSFAMDAFDEVRSGSGSHDVAEDHVAVPEGDDRVPKKKKHHRHTPEQTNELDSYFKDCPHPDEKQRIELGNRLGLESNQVKFWFQNKRTQMKTQTARQENSLLKQESERLKLENMAMKECVTRPALCKACGGSSEHRLLIENARLKEELARVREFAEKSLGKPAPEVVNALPNMVNAQGVRNWELTGLNFGVSNGAGASSSSSAPGWNEHGESVFLQVAIAAMEEVILLAQSNSPFWLKNGNNEQEVLNHDEYRRRFNPCGVNPPGFTIEASRDTGSVIITSLDLVNVLMDPRRWVEMFPGFVAKASIVEVLCSGVAGTHDGELLLMTAELLFPSPFVPLRQVRFIRYCKRHSEGTWAVVDVSVEPLRDPFGDATKRCRRFPSGFIMQDVTSGYCSVTCVEHAEYDENSVHCFFRPLVRSGWCFGAHRWIVTLQRRSECLAFLAASRNILPGAPLGMTTQGKGSLMRLARRVIDGFCAGLCASPTLRWDKLNLENMNPNLQVMTRVNIDVPGEISGVLLSFSTSIWLPISRDTLYNFLRDDQLRGHWDLLVSNGPMQEMIRINKSIHPTNAVFVLFPPVGSAKAGHMAVVQETWSDKSMSAMAYAPIDISTACTIIEGQDSSFVKIVPSGFVINDVYPNPTVPTPNGNRPKANSLLTLGFQILVDADPTAKLSLNSIQTVNVLMGETLTKIKAALGCD